MNKSDKKYFCVKAAYKDYEYKLETKYSDKIIKDYTIYEVTDDFDEDNSKSLCLSDTIKADIEKNGEIFILNTFYQKHKDIIDEFAQQSSKTGDILTFVEIEQAEISSFLATLSNDNEDYAEEKKASDGSLNEILENQKLILAKLEKYERDFEDFEYKFEGIEKAIDNIKKILEAVESMPTTNYIQEIVEENKVSVTMPNNDKAVKDAKRIITELVDMLAAGTDEYIKLKNN